MDRNSTQEVCKTLKDRLKTAESDLKSALASSDPGHPLVTPARELLAIHTEIRDLLLDHLEASSKEKLPEDQPDVAMAAVQIGRENHTLKPEFKDVVKALFMWKDDPVERVKNAGQ
mgnify:FL=1